MSELTRCNLIAGLLGAGKTTTIRHLLQQRPAHQRWAVLNNESGAIAIGGAELAGGGVVVKTVTGGCICCVAQVQLRVELTRLLRETRPDRLLIEPISSGHLGSVIAMLRAPDLHNALELGAAVCVVDPQQFAHGEISARDDYREQLALADVIVINKCDLASRPHLETLRTYARALSPPKSAIIETVQGSVDAALLDTGTSQFRRYQAAT